MPLSTLNWKMLTLGAAIAVGALVTAERSNAAEAIFAGGCFWCVESDFEQLDGVREVTSGFTGGRKANPTYKQVVKGGTGHIEAALIDYNPSRISYEDLLYNFFRSVDPTDAGGQFCDRGESYLTAIFVKTAAERAAAEAAKARAEKDLGQKIVTPIRDFDKFYAAEEYHQDYYKKSDIVLTRRGPKTKAEAYKFYRKACGRDTRVKELWGSAAPFTS